MDKRVSEDLVLGKLRIRDITQRTVSLLAGKGWGKSMTGKAICFTLAKETDLDVMIIDPLGIIDIKGFVRMIVKPGDVTQGKVLGKWLLQFRERRVIISLQGFLPGELAIFMNDFFGELNTKIKDTVVFIDEVHTFCPQNQAGSSYCFEVERAVLHWRNFNCGFILASQRPQQVNKNVLGQTDFAVLGRFTWPQSLRAIEDLIGAAAGDDTKEIIKQLQGEPSFHGFVIDFIPPEATIS